MSARILSGIYRILNIINGRVYVGSAVNISERWRIHRLHLNRGTHHCSYLQRAWIKHGPEAFVFEVIEAVDRKEDLILREQGYITNALATGRAYNLSPTAGSILGQRRSFTPEHRANLSLGQKGRTSPNKGKRMSAAHRAALSLAHKCSVLSAERIKVLALANRGRIHSKEIRENMSKAKKGHLTSAATAQIISAARKGRPLSPEHRAALSLAHQSRPGHSAETRARMSLAAKGQPKSAQHRANISLALRKRAKQRGTTS